jgi:hypothetical protein
MSDLEKLFEHAPEGATELKCTGKGFVRWFNSNGERYVNDGWWEVDSNSWQTIATRPQPERKTVEDVVEWNESVGLGDEWGHEDCDVIIIYRDGFAYSDSRATSKEIACTREEFEACVAAKAKSKPEWEYIDAFGNPCSLLIDAPDSMGNVVILRQDGWYSPVARSSLKPIKPTISKDAKAQLELYVQYRIDKYGDHAMKSDLSDYIAEHEVLE